jgi:hypothetical protein
MADTINRIISNILGPHPKKDVDVRNNRVKRKGKSTVPKDKDREQGLYRESKYNKNKED